jgi:hypothetical protein
MIARCAAIAVVVLLLTACGPFAPRSLPVGVDENSVTGMWIHDEKDSSAGATVDIRSDGTFSYRGLPAEIIDSEAWTSELGCNDLISDSTDLRSGEGTWEIHDMGISMNVDESSVWAYPMGFLSFDRIAFICDVDHAGSYVLDRAD